MRLVRRNQEEGGYATSVDFCQMFAAEIDGLYQLALVLTVDPKTAEQAFVAGLEDSLNSNHVLKQCTHSWAKLMVIQHAIRLVQPRPTDSGLVAALMFSGQERKETRCSKNHFDLSSVLSLAPFERFVLVITVLERHSDHECALLLNCFALEVRQARANALGQLANSDRTHESAVPHADRFEKNLDLSARNQTVVR